MEYLNDDSFYKILERDDIDNFTKTMEIKRLLKEDPTLLHKTLNYYEMQGEMYKQEKLRIAKLQKEKEEQFDFIKTTILHEIESNLSNGGSKYIDTAIGKLSIRKTPAKVNIVDITKIPKQYMKIEETPRLTELKKAYEEGLLPQGTIELTQSYSLIKK